MAQLLTSIMLGIKIPTEFRVSSYGRKKSLRVRKSKCFSKCYSMTLLFFSSILLLYKTFWFVLSDSVSRCVWKPWVNIRRLNYSPPVYWDSLTYMELTQWPGWLVSKSRESSCPHLSSAGIIGAHCHIWDLFGCWLIDWLVSLVWFGFALCGCWGSKLRPSCCATNFAWTELSQQLLIYFLHQG